MPGLEGWLESQSRRPGRWLAALAILLAVQLGPWVVLTPDGSVYLSMARSVVTEGRLAAFGSSHLGLAPGYAFFLVPAVAFPGLPLLPIAAVQWLLGLALMVGLYRWTRRLSGAAALLLTAFVMVNVSVWIHLRRPLSELAFMAIAIWAVEASESARSRGGIVRILAAGVLLAALAIVREVGIVLVAGLAVVTMLDSRAERRSAPARVATLVLAGAIALAAVGGLLYYDRRSMTLGEGPREIGSHLEGLLSWSDPPFPAMATGFRLRLTETGRLLVPGMFKAHNPHRGWLDPNLLVYVPVVGAALMGWGLHIRRRPDILMASFPFYVAVYLLWPFDAGTRYLLPMLPPLALSLWSLLEPLRGSRLTLLAGLVAAHLAVSVGYTVTREIPRARACEQTWPAVEAMSAAIRRAPGRVIARDTPECLPAMLAFALDRSVRGTAADTPVGKAVQWIVAPAGGPPPEGLRLALAAGDYELFVREIPPS